MGRRSDRRYSAIMRRLTAPWRPAVLIARLAFVMTDGLVATVYVSLTSTIVAAVLGTVVVLPIAAAFLWLGLQLMRLLGSFERSRYLALMGLRLEVPRRRERPSGVWQGFLATVKNGDRWREVAYFAVQSVWGFVSFALGLIAWAAPLGVLTYWATDGWGSGRQANLWIVDHSSLAWTVTVVVSSLWLVAIAPLITYGLASVDTALARRLLTPPEIGDPRRVAAQAETRRAAAVSAAEAERRRIERDLHDGAQQRLIAVALELGQARTVIETDPQRARALVEHGHEEVKGVLKDLRDLVRGLRPVILEDRGLDAALSSVVARCPFPVTVSVDVEPRPAPSIESAAYFAVSEALANSMRHADASSASVSVRRMDDRLVVEVIDNGRGGARVERAGGEAGSGLAGLVDRASALGGRVAVDSPAGGPTRIRVELPCG